MSKKKKKFDLTPILTTVITTVGVIIVALLAFPPFQRLFDPAPAPTPIPTETSTSTMSATFHLDTLTPNPTFTETYTAAPTEAFTLTPLPTTFTPTSGLPIGMQVKVIANPPSGKKPLKVNIDARDSFVRASNGDIFECRNGACSYTWYVTNPGGQPVKQAIKIGYIDLIFEKKGNYFIDVYICHGAVSPTCASGGTVVIVE